MSRSYPYLDIARRHGVPYGHVLAYADVVRKVKKVMDGGAKHPGGAWSLLDHWEREAVRAIGGDDIMSMPLLSVTCEIRDAYLAEHLRRGEHLR